MIYHKISNLLWVNILFIFSIDLSSCTKKVNPVADFSADRTNILTYTTVNFTNLSTGTESLMDVSWYFPGGYPESSYLLNPGNVKYDVAGTYPVTLTILTSEGESTITKEGFITVTQGPTVIDIDGNLYDTITIGSQVWMKQNLKTRHYRNGTEISEVYFHINPDYGYLYNGNSVISSLQLAPAGWHIPTIAEWTTLINYLGGETKAGGEMKSNTSHWSQPNIGATNNSGFSALPCGYYTPNQSTAFGMGNVAYFWSSSITTAYQLWHTDKVIYKQPTEIYLYHSVRCILDN